MKAPSPSLTSGGLLIVPRCLFIRCVDIDLCSV